VHGAEIWNTSEKDQKYLETFEMWRCRGMEKIRWTNNVRNEEVLTKSQGAEDRK